MTDKPRPRTHTGLDPGLCGEVLELSPGFARVRLTALPEMAADETGLIHGGFVFGLADHAAMVAVDHPNVVLASAEVRFLKPAIVGDILVAVARVESQEGRKVAVLTSVLRGTELLFTGELLCVTPDRHVLTAGVA